MKVLVTGGAGYIGSHTVISLLGAGHSVAIVDNFSNAKVGVIERLRAIAGTHLEVTHGDISDSCAMEELIRRSRAEAVVHFAGLKAVGESSEIPLRYYSNNVSGTVSLLAAMERCDVKTLIFSSSATVYGSTMGGVYGEGAGLGAVNPYGRTKLFVEQMLHDVAASSSHWRIGILRYFNPAGAHASGTIGEDPQGTPNNLIPYVGQVAAGRRSKVLIFGSDYDTPDGTGVRDYVHVTDLAMGHVAALRYLQSDRGIHVWNLGTGRGYSVLDVIRTFEEVTGRIIPHEIVSRRPGDVAMSIADPTLARNQLGWASSKDLRAMLSDQWRWQVRNPAGYSH